MSTYSAAQDHLLLFDGVCHLCDGAVQFILRHDAQGRVKFAPIQGETGSALYRQHGLDPQQPHTMLFITPRGAFQASDAALEIARVLGGLWHLVAPLRLLPRFVRDAAYHFIARNRYRWFGRHESCILPTHELRSRLLP